MIHETTHNGHALRIEFDSAMFGDHVRIYRNSLLTEHYIQAHGKNTCNLLRNCGEYGILPCGEVMNTAAHIYAIMCARYN